MATRFTHGDGTRALRARERLTVLLITLDDHPAVLALAHASSQPWRVRRAHHSACGATRTAEVRKRKCRPAICASSWEAVGLDQPRAEREAFYLRIAGPGDHCHKGVGLGLGILLTRGSLTSAGLALNGAARAGGAGSPSVGTRALGWASSPPPRARQDRGARGPGAALMRTGYEDVSRSRRRPCAGPLPKPPARCRPPGPLKELHTPSGR